MDGLKCWLAVFFGVLEDSIHNLVTATHLDRLEETLVLAHVLENISLQVAIQYEDGAPCYVLKCHLKRLQNLLHSLERSLTGDELLNILVDHFNFLRVDLLWSIATESTK